MIELTAGRRASILSLACAYLVGAQVTVLFGENPLISVSVWLFIGTVGVSLVLLSGRFALLNPVFMFCLLQLTLYSLNWLPFLFVPTLINDTYNLGWDSNRVERAIIVLNLLTCLWLVFAVIGNFLWKVKVTWRAADAGFNYRNIALVIIAVSILSLFVLIGKAGSFLELMIQREITREDRLAATIGRHWFAFAQMGILGVALWAFSDKRIFKSWYFLPLFATVLVTGFIVSGNRTSIVMSCVLIYGAWSLSSKKLISPVVIAMAVGLLIALGAASLVREEGFSKLQRSGYDVGTREEGFLEKLLHIRSERAIEGSASLGVLMALDDGMPFLFGESYRSIAYIPFPSALLSDAKPPAGGRLAAKELAGRTDTAWPISPVVAAYWNFGVLGVVVSGLIYGLFSGFIYRVMLNNLDSTILLVGYFSYVTRFSVGSDGFYKFFQVAIPLIALYFLLKALILVRRRFSLVNDNGC
jgi:hypothetical protein